MKGIIFNLLEQFITDNFGDELYEQILASCQLQTNDPFVGPGTYPDADLFAIVNVTATQLGLKVPDALHAFGKYALSRLAAKVPMFMHGHHHPKSFLQAIDGVIHIEVKKLYKDAFPPRITALDSAPDSLVLIYESRRGLCSLMAGLLDGTAAHFRTAIHHEQIRCTANGDDVCEFRLTFGPVGALAP